MCNLCSLNVFVSLNILPVGPIKLDCAVCAVEALKLVRPFGLLQPKKIGCAICAV